LAAPGSRRNFAQPAIQYAEAPGETPPTRQAPARVRSSSPSPGLLLPLLLSLPAWQGRRAPGVGC
jgi:hypothetical protein